MRRLTLSLFSVLFTYGCGSASPGDIIVRDSAGVEIVSSFVAQWTEETRWTLEDDPILRIGSVDGGDPATQFTYLTAVRRLSDGRVVVFDERSGELRWFGTSGTHQFSRGGRGGGPGEFDGTAYFLALPGDTLLVLGVPRLRFTRYDPQGTLIEETRVDLDKYARLGPWSECLRQFLPDKSLVGCHRDEQLPFSREGIEGRFRNYVRVVTAPPSLDTIYHLGVASGIEQWGVSVGGRVTYVRHPFHSYGVVSTGGTPSRVAIALNPDYSVEIWTPEGQLERIVRRPQAQRAATSAERAEAEERLRSRSSDTAEVNRGLAAMKIPDRPPAALELRLSPDNHLWVLRYPLDGRWHWDVFDPSGGFLGEVQVPAGFIVYEVGTDYLLGVTRDQNDVPFVEMFRLRRQ